MNETTRLRNCEERFQEWNDVDGSGSAQRGGGRMLGQRNQVSKVETEVGSDSHTTHVAPSRQ